MKVPTRMDSLSSCSGIDQEAIDRANAQLETLADGFIEWAMGETIRAEVILQAIQKTDVAGDDDVGQVLDVMHNLKGQGGTFGFDLVTHVASIGCDALRPPVDMDAVRIHFLQACLSVIKSVLANRMVGDGGEPGQELVRRIEAMSVATKRPE